MEKHELNNLRNQLHRQVESYGQKLDDTLEQYRASSEQERSKIFNSIEHTIRTTKALNELGKEILKGHAKMTYRDYMSNRPEVDTFVGEVIRIKLESPELSSPIIHNGFMEKYNLNPENDSARKLAEISESLYKDTGNSPSIGTYIFDTSA